MVEFGGLFDFRCIEIIFNSLFKEKTLFLYTILKKKKCTFSLLPDHLWYVPMSKTLHFLAPATSEYDLAEVGVLPFCSISFLPSGNEIPLVPLTVWMSFFLFHTGQSREKEPWSLSQLKQWTFGLQSPSSWPVVPPLAQVSSGTWNTAVD